MRSMRLGLEHEARRLHGLARGPSHRCPFLGAGAGGLGPIASMIGAVHEHAEVDGLPASVAGRCESERVSRLAERNLLDSQAFAFSDRAIGESSSRRERCERLSERLRTRSDASGKVVKIELVSPSWARCHDGTVRPAARTPSDPRRREGATSGHARADV